MKAILSAIFISMVIFVSSCSKSDPAISRINCEGLVTDTSGTGDNAKIYMPNAFTPNGDGLNDIVRPVMQNISSFVFIIYDSNNDIVFTSSTPLQSWSTTVSQNSFETFYYKIQSTTNNGNHIGACGELYKLSCLPATAPTIYFEDQLTAGGFTNPTGEILPICP